MRILVVHQYYLLPGYSGGSRFNEMTRLWAERGHDVTVLAGTTDYLSGDMPKRFRRRWVTREQEGRVTVYRCRVPTAYARGYAGRMWAFLAFTFSAATAALLARPPDIVVATSPPLVAALPGWLAAHRPFRRKPWIFEIRDLWPESAITTGVLTQGAPLTRMLYAMERWACKAAARVNVLTPAFRDDLVRRGLAPAAKIEMIPNGADANSFMPGDRNNAIRREWGWGDRTVALYAGAHGRANAVGQLLEAAACLAGRPDILIACVGGGPEFETLRAQATNRNLSNIVFQPAVAKNRMPEVINAADIGVAVLQNNPTFRTVYPNKVFDYMACARPVLVAIDGAARHLVCNQAKAGLFAEPEDGAAIARQLAWLADNPQNSAEMGARGRRWVLANATREALADRYLSVMEGLVCPA